MLRTKRHETTILSWTKMEIYYRYVVAVGYAANMNGFLLIFLSLCSEQVVGVVSTQTHNTFHCYVRWNRVCVVSPSLSPIRSLVFVCGVHFRSLFRQPATKPALQCADNASKRLLHHQHITILLKCGVTFSLNCCSLSFCSM